MVYYTYTMYIWHKQISKWHNNAVKNMIYLGMYKAPNIKTVNNVDHHNSLIYMYSQTCSCGHLY